MFNKYDVNGYGDSDRCRTLFDSNVENVRLMALHFYAGHNYINALDEDDFTLIGLAALWEATKQYDSAQNSSFWGYARVRVEGSMLDAMRSFDPISRLERERLQEIKAQRHLLEQARGTTVSFLEAGRTIGIGLEELRQLDELNNLSFLELDAQGRTSDDSTNVDTPLHDIIVDQTATDPSVQCDIGNDVDLLDRLMDRLDDASRAVIRAHFWNGLREKDIGRAFGLTESRVSQIINQSITKMRRGAKDRF